MPTKRKQRPKPKPIPKELTERQKAFAREYLIDYNGQQAAIRAGYSARSAKVTASRMLTQANVQKELAKRAAPINAKKELKASEVLDKVVAIAFGDIRQLLEAKDKNGRMTIKDLRDLTFSEQMLVKGFKRDAQGNLEVKIEDRLTATKLLMQNLGLLKQQMRLEVSSELTLEEEERVRSFTDEELEEWNQANDVIHRLLHPEVSSTSAA